MTKMWQPWMIGLLGLWLVIAAFLPLPALGNMWDDLIVGLLASYAGFSMIKEYPWQSWLSGVLGLWLIVAAFLPTLHTHLGNAWNAGIVGILLLVAGIGSIWGGSRKAAH